MNVEYIVNVYDVWTFDCLHISYLWNWKV